MSFDEIMKRALLHKLVVHGLASLGKVDGESAWALSPAVVRAREAQAQGEVTREDEELLARCDAVGITPQEALKFLAANLSDDEAIRTLKWIGKHDLAHFDV